MSETMERDPALQRAREEAEGTDLLERPERGSPIERQREHAEGVTVYADPDAVIPACSLTEGPPGEEHLTGNAIGLGRDDNGEHRPATDEAG